MDIVFEPWMGWAFAGILVLLILSAFFFPARRRL